jgi:hypothetical protein
MRCDKFDANLICIDSNKAKKTKQMSKSLTFNFGECVDYRLHLGYNGQYRAPIHKIQHVFAGTVYGVISASGIIGELAAAQFDDWVKVITTKKLSWATDLYSQNKRMFV